MKKIFLILIPLLTLLSCKKDKECEDCQTGTLYYTPDCASINGYIIMDEMDKTYVFKDEIEEEFQQSNIKVCINYKSLPEEPVFADCVTEEVIKINCIRKN